MRLTPRAAILAVVVMVLLLYTMVPLRSYLEQRTRLAELQRQSQVLQQQQADLLRQIAQLQDPNYLQRIARECLGLVRPGEIAFVIVPKTEPANLPGC
jgi:cell division protein FtsB